MPEIPSMTQQMIAFLEKYQLMRKTKNDYLKSSDRFKLKKYMQMELELDVEAQQIMVELDRNKL